jgi:hypothetical protein
VSKGYTSTVKYLTTEDEARLPRWRRLWKMIGLSTKPADRAAAERAIGEAYARAGLRPPERIVWCGSPLSQGIARAFASARRQPIGAAVGRKIENSTWHETDTRIARAVQGRVAATVREGVMDKLTDLVRRRVELPIRSAVGAAAAGVPEAAVESPFWESLRDWIAGQLRASVRDSISGQHDADWLGFYDYFRHVLGLRTETEALQGLIGVARAAGWWLPHERVCWVSERPSRLIRDKRGLLHSTTGPAVSFPDGWCIYLVHGVQVPARWFREAPAKELPTLQQHTIDRRLVERLGYEWLIESDGAPPLHVDEYGSLYQIGGPHDEPVMLVSVRNPPDKSGREHRYVIPVHPELCPMRETETGDIEFGEPQEPTARNAVASTYGMRGCDYSPARRT